MSGFGTYACRLLLDVSLIHFVVSLLSQIKSILGLADQRAHISTSVWFGSVVKPNYQILERFASRLRQTLVQNLLFAKNGLNVFDIRSLLACQQQV